MNNNTPSIGAYSAELYDLTADILEPEDFTEGRLFHLYQVETLSPGDQYGARVKLRELAKAVGIEEALFDLLWTRYISPRKQIPGDHPDAQDYLPKSIRAVIDKLKLNPDGSIKSTIDNYTTILTEDPALSGKIRYNEFSQRPERQGELPWSTGRDGAWTDCDDAELRAYIQRYYELDKKRPLDDAIRIVLQRSRYNPVKQKLESLPAWDGIPRIADLFPKFLGAEKSDYTAAITHNFLQAAISRIYNPGCKYDYVLILIGNQGTGKSTLLRLLSMEDTWFSDSIDSLSGREGAERTHGKWIIELQELKALKKGKEIESIKAFITTQNDYYREPYARRAENHPRQCVFAGTTNEMFFLTDRTGNRRFLPLETSGGDVNLLFESSTRDYIEHCWAEALTLFREANGQPQLSLPPAIEEIARTKQLAHLEEDARIPLIQAWLDATRDEYVSITEIWRDALGKAGTPNRRETNELHKLLKHDIVGWQPSPSKHRTRYNNSPARCYIKESG